MPKPINPNLPPTLKREDGVADAAAYRESLSLKEAANMIKKSSRGAALKERGWRFTTILKDIVVKGKKPRSKFNTNPWLGNQKVTSANEYTVEDQVWRLISYSHDGKEAEWFLAHHKGSFNQFEFWHISDANSFKPKPASNTALPVAPTFTGKDIFDDQHGVTQEIVTPPSGPVADSWEDL